MTLHPDLFGGVTPMAVERNPQLAGDAWVARFTAELLPRARKYLQTRDPALYVERQARAFLSDRHLYATPERAAMACADAWEPVGS